MRFKRTFTDPVPKSRKEAFAETGVTAFHGRAHFTSRMAIELDDEVLETRYTAIATGARLRKLNIPGKEYITTSDQFLEFRGAGFDEHSIQAQHLIWKRAISVRISRRLRAATACRRGEMDQPARGFVP
jgi:hypothetical protein